MRFSASRAKLTGQTFYEYIAEHNGKDGPRIASEFLARAGIDGIKYPVDSYGGKVKNGDEVGWNYVSFRDDNIRVDHKWVDGEQRYSVEVRNPWPATQGGTINELRNYIKNNGGRVVDVFSLTASQGSTILQPSDFEIRAKRRVADKFMSRPQIRGLSFWGE